MEPESIAKLTRPRGGDILVRDRLYGVLDRASQCPATWISSPPGSGKTSLVSGYVDHLGLPCLWYRLEQRDKDPSTFFHYVTLGSFGSRFTDGPADGCNMEIPNRQAGDPYILNMSSQESGGGTLPPDTTFPWGLFDFKVVDVPPGGTVRMAFTMTEDIPAGSTF
jgi:hypothetical protein